MELVLATANVHKLREMRDMLKSMLKSAKNFDIVSLMNYQDYVAPEETGSTFQENAQIKAVDAARVLNRWVVADDSGLVVPAINGEPGVRSRRYSESATDKDNNKKLLDRMQGLNGLERSAYYECCICICSPEGKFRTFTGHCEGVIIDAPRGSNGFGYDPLFLKHDHQKTFGELTEDTKNRISHRRKALDKAVTFLETIK